jgi:hypothetical protein
MSYIELYGLIRSPAFHQGKDILKGLSKEVRGVSEGMLETDWEIFQQKKNKQNRGKLRSFVLCGR